MNQSLAGICDSGLRRVTVSMSNFANSNMGPFPDGRFEDIMNIILSLLQFPYRPYDAIAGDKLSGL